MKQFKALVDVLQDIIAETFQIEENCVINNLKGVSSLCLSPIREIAQKALNEHKKDIPKPKVNCPSDRIIGKDYYRFTECLSCPREYAQICSVYNYVWYQ